jgi:uncharacterized small protein (TIGR04563 family)
MPWLWARALAGIGAFRRLAGDTVIPLWVMSARKNRDEKIKQSLYFPADMLAEIASEAGRLGRPLSWVVHRAWLLARDEIRRLPSLESAEGPADAR